MENLTISDLYAAKLFAGEQAEHWDKMITDDKSKLSSEPTDVEKKNLQDAEDVLSKWMNIHQRIDEKLYEIIIQL